MAANLDHMILPVNELDRSLEFYCDLLQFDKDAEQGPFQGVRVNESLVLLLSPYGTKGGLHLAFNFSRDQFNAIFANIKSKGMDYGDRFDQVDNGQGPTLTEGAQGDQPALYVMDPDQHLIELRYTVA